jgi:hypothetical protein
MLDALVDRDLTACLSDSDDVATAVCDPGAAASPGKTGQRVIRRSRRSTESPFRAI